MVQKRYDWNLGATLEDHSRKKHTILRRYFEKYLFVRCQNRRMEKFRLAIIDGFSGSGRYNCGHIGSPLIFLDSLINVVQSINATRTNEGLKPLQVECLFVFNDLDPDAISKLRTNTAPYVAAIGENPFVNAKVEYFNQAFEDAYPTIKAQLINSRFTNVFFNLDQCGYSKVSISTIRDIMSNWKSSELLLTFTISSLLAYLSPEVEKSKVPLDSYMLAEVRDIISRENGILSKQEWLGRVEKLVFESLRSCAGFVSPFSINNPGGWQYWLMHFANSYRARQVYNDVLHDEDVQQAHFGRSGLRMLSYDPSSEGQLYIFDTDSRELSKNELYDDIPNYISRSGDVLSMQDFYSDIYSDTPAHSDDIHEMIIANPDVSVITEAGGERRVPNTIKSTDIIKLNPQRKMFFMFK